MGGARGCAGARLCVDRPGLVNDLAALVMELGLNLDDSRMTVLGGEFAVLMSVASEADVITPLEPRLGSLPYHVRVTAMDHPRIVQRIAGFFSSREINIEDLRTETKHAAHTGTPIFNLEMQIHVPAGTGTRALRQEFEDFCDERDLDGSLDPG